MAPPTGVQQDAAPLLHNPPTASEGGEQPGDSGDSSAQGSSWGWFHWLRGGRLTAERPPTSDETDVNEMQERAGRPPANIAVVVEGQAAAAPPPHSQGTSFRAGAQSQQAGSSGAGAPTAADTAASDDTSGASTSGGRGDEIEPRPLGSPQLSRLPSRGQPTCLICLEEFRQEEFINGAALRLECNCRGDLALRHRDCVMKWVQVKGSNVCELCKAEIRNIPAPPPRATDLDLPALDETYFNDPSHIHDFMPSSQDLVFDCIRVCWVAMIVSILFFEMNLGAALWTGMLAGLAYSIMVRFMYRQHFSAMRRLAETQAAARREAEGGEAGGAEGAPGGAAGTAGGAPPPLVVAV